MDLLRGSCTDKDCKYHCAHANKEWDELPEEEKEHAKHNEKRNEDGSFKDPPKEFCRRFVAEFSRKHGWLPQKLKIGGNGRMDKLESRERISILDALVLHNQKEGAYGNLGVTFEGSLPGALCEFKWDRYGRPEFVWELFYYMLMVRHLLRPAPLARFASGHRRSPPLPTAATPHTRCR